MAKSSYSADMDFRLSASLKLLTGVRTANVFGLRDNVNSAGGISDLINFGPEDYPFPSDTGEQIKIRSANAGDTGLTYVIDGLDKDGLRQIITVQLDGTDATTAVTVLDENGDPSLFSRINFFFNDSATKSVGNVTLENSALDTIYSNALSMDQQANSGIFTNPADEQISIIGLIPILLKPGGGDTGGEIMASFRLKGKIFRGPVGFGLHRSGNTTIALENLVPDTLPGFTDIKLQAAADAASTTMAARLAIILTKAPVPTP